MLVKRNCRPHDNIICQLAGKFVIFRWQFKKKIILITWQPRLQLRKCHCMSSPSTWEPNIVSFDLWSEVTRMASSPLQITSLETLWLASTMLSSRTRAWNVNVGPAITDHLTLRPRQICLFFSFSLRLFTSQQPSVSHSSAPYPKFLPLQRT